MRSCQQLCSCQSERNPCHDCSSLQPCHAPGASDAAQLRGSLAARLAPHPASGSVWHCGWLSLLTNTDDARAQDGTGKISLRMLQSFASKHGGETLTLEDLKGLFQDFKPSNENFINQQEFLLFFAKVCGWCRAIANTPARAVSDLPVCE